MRLEDCHEFSADEDLEEGDRGLFQGTIHAFAWTD
jgi:hypothetical protein